MGRDDLQDASELWKRADAALRASLPLATYQLWLEPLRPLSLDGGTLRLAAPERVRVWVERRYTPLLLQAISEQGDAVSSIQLVPESTGTKEQALEPGAPGESPIDAHHTFESFVIGPGNRFAHAAALAVAELPGEAYNPLFLHGPPGLGKTHLMGAIAGYLREQHPDINVIYTTAEHFTTEFVHALRSDGPDRFKRRYRELDALLIDDVQVLEGKARTEEEFVHTFNTLHAAGKQIVLSSDRPPQSLGRLEERLRDRFQWGLTVAIDPPDLRTRMTLLWRLAGNLGDAILEPDALREIADRVPGNVRLLEGALTRVVALASVFREPVDSTLVQRALNATSAPEPRKPTSTMAPSVEAIRDAVCQVLGVEPSQVLSPSRVPRVARARQLSMYLAREMTPLSLAQIAREFNRDHSTVIHSIRAVEGRNELGSETQQQIHSVRACLGRVVESSGRGDEDIHDDPLPPQAN